MVNEWTLLTLLLVPMVGLVLGSLAIELWSKLTPLATSLASSITATEQASRSHQPISRPYASR